MPPVSTEGGGRGRSSASSPVLPSEQQPRSVLRGHGDGLGSSAPDVYSVGFHPSEAHVVTAGHDRTVRLYDIESGQVRCVREGVIALGAQLYVYSSRDASFFGGRGS